MKKTGTQVVILRTDGTHEVKRLVVECKTLASEIHCNYVERLVCEQGYEKEGTRHYLTCWVNEEGFCEERAHNPYAPLLNALGLQLSFGKFVYGDAVLYSTDRAQRKKLDVSAYVLDVVQQFDACDDDVDTFLQTLVRQNT